MTTTRSATRATPWLVHGSPGDAEFLLFGFHYAGVGAASSYRDWPARIGGGWFCPLQPPGREDRIMEEPLRSHRAFAEDLVPVLRERLDRPYAFVGHCGAYTYMLDTTLHLAELGLPLPAKLFASSWGAPHAGLYGRLNFLDLDDAGIETDLVAEIQDVSLARTGQPLPADLAELAAETLLFDLRVQRAYRYDGTPKVPVPTVVVSWRQDTVVPPELVVPGWQECAEVTFHEFDGDHWEFLRCPEALRSLIVAEMS
ncbi:thioesterase II family protein [Actinophytocola xinjiangensis]|uniref:thioesterase II family protein n=1 Tax=Actinophytocola xinjiangensis TaxID=485602 RepID=UPI000B05EDDF|nr:thioesterase domain-containing protein [Actinophytocola xinjiangensis]